MLEALSRIRHSFEPAMTTENRQTTQPSTGWRQRYTMISLATLAVFAVSYTHLRAHETKANLVCRLLLE